MYVNTCCGNKKVISKKKKKERNFYVDWAAAKKGPGYGLHNNLNS